MSFFPLPAPGPKPVSAPVQLAPVAENCVRLRPRPAWLGGSGPQDPRTIDDSAYSIKPSCPFPFPSSYRSWTEDACCAMGDEPH